MYHIGWFSTARGQGSRDLLRTACQTIEEGEIRAEIAFLFSNREVGESRETDLFFELVNSYKIPLICLSSRRFKERFGKGWRPEFEREAMGLLADLHPDLCVLSGYMLIVGKEMCRRYPMINLHPAAPGGLKGMWQEIIWKLMEEKAAQTGAMMHLVTPELDEGPPVTYCTFYIRGEPFDKYWQEIEGTSIAQVKAEQGENNALFRQIRRHGLAREFPLITSTLKAFSEGRVRIEGENVVDSMGRVIAGYDLTEEIDERVKGALT